MFTFLAIVHIVVSALLVLFILLQDPKGGGGALGMLGGGSSKSLFGSTGGNQFLVNVTKWLALLFAFTSIYLAALSARTDKSIMDDYIPPAGQNPVDSAKSQTPASIPAEKPPQNLNQELEKKETLAPEDDMAEKPVPTEEAKNQ